MKVVFEKEELLKGLNVAVKAASKKTTMPILKAIVIEIQQEQAIVKANNLDIGIETVIPVKKVTEEGVIAIEGAFFLNIIKEFPNNKEIKMESKNNYEVVVKCGKSSFKLPTFDASTFTEMPKMKTTRQFTLPTDVLKKGLRSTLFAADPNNNTEFMRGIVFEVTNNNLTMLGTDGHRMSNYDVGNISESVENFVSIIPAESLTELVKILEEMGKEVSLCFEEKQVLIESEKTKFVTRLINEKPVDFSKFFAMQCAENVQMNRKDVLDAVGRSLLLRGSENRGVCLSFEQNKMGVLLESHVGKMHEELEIKREQAEEVKIGLNPYFLLDALKSTDAEIVELCFTNPQTPVFIKVANHVQIIMPVRLL